jgi:hypothetical protein
MLEKVRRAWIERATSHEPLIRHLFTGVRGREILRS